MAASSIVWLTNLDPWPQERQVLVVSPVFRQNRWRSQRESCLVANLGTDVIGSCAVVAFLGALPTQVV